MSWNSMLAAYVHQSKAEKALRLYELMLEEGPTPNDRTIVSAVQACGMLAEEAIDINGQLVKTKCLVSVKALQSAAWSFGYSHDLFVRNSVLSMYAKCGSILDAEIIFYGLHKECVKSWNAMISVHVIQGQAEKVLQLHDQMLEDGVRPDDQTLVSMLHACAMLAEHEEETLVDGQRIRVKALQRVKIAHADAWIRGFTLYPHTCKSLVSTYGKCGSIMDAQSILDGLSETDVLSWNALLTCYAHSGQAKKTLEMYKQMIDELVSPNAGTFVSMMQAFSSLGEREDDVTLDGAPTRILWLKEAKTIQAEMWRMGYGQNQFIGNTLISMYGRLGSIADALAVFERLPESTIVSWNVLLVAYALQHQVEKVFELYEQMLHEGVSPDDRTYVSLLQACGMLAEKEDIVTGDEQSIKVKALDKGKAIHAAAWASGYKSDVFIGNTLVSMYGKCGSLLDGQTVFNGLPQRTVVSWNSILTAYTQKGQEQRSLDLYREMLEEGVSPDVITLMSLLQACSKTGCLDSCRQLHHSLVSTRKYLSPILASTLIHAYGRCASMVEAQNAFNLLPQPDVVSWNALCAGYARHGDWEAVLRCYTQMQLADVRPNGVTFLSLLSACSHAGLVDQGVTYFNAMTRDHSISPETEHYASMIDLLGRAGYFTLVEDVLSAMPMQPNLSTWLCLLGACRKHGKVSLGQHAFDCAIRVDPNHCAPYLLMSNIYAQAGLWDRANEVNEFRLKASAWKNPGQSWIKFEEEIHTFVVGDFQHQQDMQVHNLIGYLRLAIKATEHTRHGI